MSEGKDRVKAAPQEDNDRTGIIAAGAEAQSFLSPSPTNQIEGRDRRPTPTGTPHQRTGDSRSGSGLGCHHRRRPCQDDWLHHASPPTWPEQTANTRYLVARRRANTNVCRRATAAPPPSEVAPRQPPMSRGEKGPTATMRGFAMAATTGGGGRGER